MVVVQVAEVVKELAQEVDQAELSRKGPTSLQKKVPGVPQKKGVNAFLGAEQVAAILHIYVAGSTGKEKKRVKRGRREENKNND